MPTADDQLGPPAWDARSFGFGDFQRALSREALRELSLDEARGAEGSLGAELLEIKTRLVDGSPGYAVLTGLASLDRARWRGHFRTISTFVGEPCPQDGAGTEVREVRDRGTRIGEGEQARYADSRHGGSLHTDGAEAPLPVPDYFSLLCVERALSGGAFQMVCARAAYERLLARAPEAARALCEPFHFDRRGDAGEGASPTTQKPVFFFEAGDLAVTYLRAYIDLGHARAGAPLTPAQIEALDRLDALLVDPELVVEGLLEPGSVLLVNNKRILHGRTTFADGEGPSAKRLLLRMWLKARAERS